MEQVHLFAETSKLPAGFRYRPEFVTRQEEASLLQAIEQLPFRAAQYKQFRTLRGQ